MGVVHIDTTPIQDLADKMMPLASFSNRLPYAGHMGEEFQWESAPPHPSKERQSRFPQIPLPQLAVTTRQGGKKACLQLMDSKLVLLVSVHQGKTLGSWQMLCHWEKYRLIVSPLPQGKRDKRAKEC